jgi:hypothetical protein
MTEIILIVVLAVFSLSIIGTSLYQHRAHQKTIEWFIDSNRALTMEHLQRQRELEEFAFIEAKERRVYVDLAQKKVERYGTPEFVPPIQPYPSTDNTSWPMGDVTYEDMIAAAGARRSRPTLEEEPDING